MNTTAADFIIEKNDRGTRRSREAGPWYVTTPPGKFYLHRDGVWRMSTAVDGTDDLGAPTVDYRGYFPTREAAQQALDAALAAVPVAVVLAVRVSRDPWARAGLKALLKGTR